MYISEIWEIYTGDFVRDLGNIYRRSPDISGDSHFVISLQHFPAAESVGMRRPIPFEHTVIPVNKAFCRDLTGVLDFVYTTWRRIPENTQSPQYIHLPRSPQYMMMDADDG